MKRNNLGQFIGNSSIIKKCNYCGKEFKSYSSESKKFCSRECFYNSRKIKNICENCGKEFITRKSEQKRFCSSSCSLKFQHRCGRRNKTYKKISDALKGRRRKKETLRKMSEAMKKLWGDNKYRDKVSVAHIGNIPWNKGTSKFPSKEESNRYYSKIRRARLKGAAGSFTYREWTELKKKYNNTCPMCKKKEPEIKLTIDHKIPISRGGSNYIENIQPLCERCNSVKNNKTWNEIDLAEN